MENETLTKIREFLARTDLSGTNEKLKENALKLDKDLAQARGELEQLTKSTNEKQVQVVYLSQRLEALCELILEVSADVGAAPVATATEAPAEAQ